MLVLLSICSHAAIFNIVPQTSLPTSVPQGGNIKAYYTVTNTTGSFHAGNYVKYLPRNVVQVMVDNTVSNLCGATFSLPAGGQCVLELNITGAVNGNAPNPSDHLFVCLGGCVACCAGTNYPLNVKQSASGIVPNVSATNPTDSSINVPIATNIGITFSIPMNTNTLIPANFQLYNQTTSTIVTLSNPIYSNSNMTVTFSTTAPLNANHSYQIIIPIPANVTSAAGVALSTGGVQSTFTTGSSTPACQIGWVLNAGDNTISQCSSDATNGGLFSCTAYNVQGDTLNNPTAMIWSGLELSITNASGPNPLIVIDTIMSLPPFIGVAIPNSAATMPTGVSTLRPNAKGWIANNNGTLTYCTTAETMTGSGSWGGCSVIAPTNYPATATNIGVLKGTNSVLYTVNTTSNSISACPIDIVNIITACSDAGGSSFHQPAFILGSTPPNIPYVLVANKCNNTVLRCDVNNGTFVLSNCVSTGSNFNQPVSIYEADNGFAYITNKVNNSITICTDTQGTLTNCTSIGGGFNGPVATVVSSCG